MVALSKGLQSATLSPGEGTDDLRRDLREAARSCASRAPRRVVATAEDGLSAPRATPISSWGGGGGANMMPGSPRDDAAGYIRRPRLTARNNQGRFRRATKPGS